MSGEIVVEASRFPHFDGFGMWPSGGGWTSGWSWGDFFSPPPPGNDEVPPPPDQPEIVVEAPRLTDEEKSALDRWWDLNVLLLPIFADANFRALDELGIGLDEVTAAGPGAMVPYVASVYGFSEIEAAVKAARIVAIGEGWLLGEH